MNKYPWSGNPLKLQRAIEKANTEQQPPEARDARIKEIYISMGGKLVDLQENNKDINMDNEEKEIPEEKIADDVEVSTNTADTVEEIKGDIEGSAQASSVGADEIEEGEKNPE